MAYHLDTKQLFIGTDKGGLYHCEVTRITNDDTFGKDLELIYDFGESIFSIAVTEDDCLIAVGLRLGAIAILKVEGYVVISKHKMHDGPVLKMLWIQGDAMLASCGRDGRVWVWRNLNPFVLENPLALAKATVNQNYTDISQSTEIYDHEKAKEKTKKLGLALVKVHSFPVTNMD